MYTIKSTSKYIGVIVMIAVYIISCDNSTSSVESNNIEKSKPVNNKVTTKKKLADGSSKFLGNIITNPNNIPSSFNTYWNQITPENAGKWGSLEPQQGNWNWGALDNTYSYAQNHGMAFKEHTFVWGSQEPSWISSLSQNSQHAAVEDFISSYFSRYPNTDYVDVVNEPLHTQPSYKNALGGDGSTGWDWVIEAFELANQYNSDAKLLINEYGIISNPNAARQYRDIINLLKNRGLIDGIGIQCHAFNMDDVSTSTMNQVLDILSSTGLPIYVSELDMRGSNSQQQSRYSNKFPVFWENSNVKGVTLWGYRQGHMWQDNAYLLRSDGSERAALQWLDSYLDGSSGGSGGGSRGSGSNSIAVRAKGTSGNEEINIRIDNQTAGSFTLSTSYAIYNVNTNLTGTVNVQFYNDASGRDVQVDYAKVNGDPRQAEDQNYNTAAYADGECGGGSYTEIMNCNGIIRFGNVSGGSGHTIVVRAKGTNGDEQIDVLVNNQSLDTFTLSTGYQSYTTYTSQTGDLNVEFTNDNSNRDVQVDYVQIDGDTRQAEDQSYNTAAYADGQCGGGSYTETMNCNGVIGFGSY